MKIVNAMFGKGLGGIEQAFVDYTAALKAEGHSVINLVRPGSRIIDDLWPVARRIYRVRSLGGWDYLSILHIKKILTDFHPDAIITHGSRAFTLLKRTNFQHTPIIAVVHNYNFKRLLSADAFFCITAHLEKSLITEGIDMQKIHRIPNMVKTENTVFNFSGWQGRKPIIGTMGRFVKKKGFDNFLEALAILKSRSVDFSAVIGGTGEEERYLKEMVENLGLADNVIFAGWVLDKKAFFAAIDIFCLPSLHEPFGIVLLEALAHGKPVASSDSEGPSEIIRHEENGLIFRRGDAGQMADVLEKLIKNQQLAEWVADGGYKTARLEYDQKSVGGKISVALAQIMENRRYG